MDGVSGESVGLVHRTPHHARSIAQWQLACGVIGLHGTWRRATCEIHVPSTRDPRRPGRPDDAYHRCPSCVGAKAKRSWCRARGRARFVRHPYALRAGNWCRQQGGETSQREDAPALKEDLPRDGSEAKRNDRMNFPKTCRLHTTLTPGSIANMGVVIE